MTRIFDTVVVGGGIIAAASGQHLAAAGYRTLLVERDEYGSGTSSKTSRLQHCGLGYLSAARGSVAAFLAHPRRAIDCFSLLHLSMLGRAEFVGMAPERVKPVTFIIPLAPENAIPCWMAARLAILEEKVLIKYGRMTALAATGGVQKWQSMNATSA